MYCVLVETLEGWTTSQVARYLGLSAERVRQFMRSGKLEPSVFTPYGALYDPDDVAAFKAQREKEQKNG